jgi:hypothetical protein
LVWSVVVPGVGEGGLPVWGHGGVGVRAGRPQGRDVCYIALGVVSMRCELWFGGLRKGRYLSNLENVILGLLRVETPLLLRLFQESFLQSSHDMVFHR